MVHPHRSRMLPPWSRFLIALLSSLLLFLEIITVPQTVYAAETHIPSATYYGAAVPDWGQVTFTSLPELTQGGFLQVPNSVVGQLGYDPSRSWSAGAALESVLLLGDVADSFGLQKFSMGAIASLTGLNLETLSLSNLPLLKEQTIASLVQAVPGLGNLPLAQVRPLYDLVTSSLSQTGREILSVANQTLSQIATHDILGSLSVNQLGDTLSQYSFTSIPGLEQTALGNLPGWQHTFIEEVPGLAHIPFASFPNSPVSGYFGFIAIHDVTYGGDRFHKESTRKPTQFSISGSYQVGFNYNCAQERGCDYLELNSPISLGVAGDPSRLHGARWIRGGDGPGEQMVQGGHGVLGQLNGGMEPTGRHPFGEVFKVVLTDTDESTGTGQFGLYFRVCSHGIIDLGCTPYFIGPVPWLSSKEKGLVFVGLTEGTAPHGIEQPPIPSEIQDQINQQGGGTDPSGTSGDSNLCGDGPAGVDWRALSDAITSIESAGSGVYSAVGQVHCDSQGCMIPLGRYQFMSFRNDLRAIVAKKPGGREFLSRLDAGYRPPASEMLRYFPASDQDALFKQAMTQDIQYYQRRGKQGDELLACLGENWYSGNCTHSSRRDYIGGPTVAEYGQRTVTGYRRSLQQRGKSTCNISSGQQGNGKATGTYTKPVTGGVITSPYGWRTHPITGNGSFHSGVDYGADRGTQVKAADGGVVVDVLNTCTEGNYACGGGYGNVVVIDHGNGRTTLYGHLQTNSIPWKKGQKVSKGQLIGRVGSTGRSTGPHLHFETSVNGKTVDPRQYGL
ncbi:MAG: M23 family metallopeptidase [Leptolyngbyaceae cyanobacterium bins.59]|nr:M23 family metallopeptidase [Leptolyngbyaceae cyanobacterium bins.59]